jgi:hypothetical protein
LNQDICRWKEDLEKLTEWTIGGSLHWLWQSTLGLQLHTLLGVDSWKLISGFLKSLEGLLETKQWLLNPMAAMFFLLYSRH